MHFTSMGGAQFWNSTFGTILDWVFGITDLMPLISTVNQLPLMNNLNPITWAIPAIIIRIM